MKTKMIRIELEAPCGAAIGDVCVDAIMQAMTYKCNVSFTFNDKTYHYIFNDLIASCSVQKFN